MWRIGWFLLLLTAIAFLIYQCLWHFSRSWKNPKVLTPLVDLLVVEVGGWDGKQLVNFSCIVLYRLFIVSNPRLYFAHQRCRRLILLLLLMPRLYIITINRRLLIAWASKHIRCLSLIDNGLSDARGDMAICRFSLVRVLRYDSRKHMFKLLLWLLLIVMVLFNGRLACLDDFDALDVSLLRISQDGGDRRTIISMQLRADISSYSTSGFFFRRSFFRVCTIQKLQ